MRNVLKKLGYWLVYFSYLLIFVGAIDYFFFYRPFIKRVETRKTGPLAGARDTHQVKIPNIRHVSAEDMKKLGKARNDKVSSFVNFEQAKEAGKIRVCGMGDSFAEGGEVDQFNDYPTLLQKVFEKNGANNVEVLNFGIGGYGFQQSYMIWDWVAKKFDCDFHLLGPRGFQYLRDLTFGYIYHWSPYYLHARYILDDGDARLIEVIGDTYGERFDAHFRFIQPWRYLRYGRNTPMFIKALLPQGTDVRNPLYYDRRSLKEEGTELQRILLGKMAASGATTFVGHYRPSAVESALSVDSENLGTAPFHEVITFPYVAPLTHSGSWGNDYLAWQYFAHLTGRESEPLTILELVDLPWTTQGAKVEERRTLASHEKVRLTLGDTDIGQFSLIQFSPPPSTNVDGLVSINHPSQSVLDTCFFPVKMELQPGMEILLREETSSGNRDHKIGQISVLDRFNIGAAKLEGFKFWHLKDFDHMEERGMPSPFTHGKKRFRGLFFEGSPSLALDQLGKGAVSILVDGQTVLRGEWGDMGLTPGIWFSPAEGKCRIPRANLSGLVDVPGLPEDSGTIDIVAEHWEDGTVRVPIVGWKKKGVQPVTARALPKIISIQPDGTAILKNRSQPE